MSHNAAYALAFTLALGACSLITLKATNEPKQPEQNTTVVAANQPATQEKNPEKIAPNVLTNEDQRVAYTDAPDLNLDLCDLDDEDEDDDADLQ